MQVILKREVDNLGLAGDVVDVADGYGRNYLLPRGLAIIATQGGMKEAEALTRSRKVSESKTLGTAQAAKETLESRTLMIEARVDDRGSLYGSVSSLDVARVLKERGHDIPRKRIDLKGTIKVIGTYEIPVQVHPQVSATVTLEVLDEEGKVTVQNGSIVNEDDVEPPPLLTETSDPDELAAKALEAAEVYEAEQSASEGADEETTEVAQEASSEETAEAAPEAPAEDAGDADAGDADAKKADEVDEA